MVPAGGVRRAQGRVGSGPGGVKTRDRCDRVTSAKREQEKHGWCEVQRGGTIIKYEKFSSRRGIFPELYELFHRENLLYEHGGTQVPAGLISYHIISHPRNARRSYEKIPGTAMVCSNGQQQYSSGIDTPGRC